MSPDAGKVTHGPVILPLDTSPLAEAALPHARALAEARSLGLMLVSVWDKTDQDLGGALTSVQNRDLERVALEIYRRYLAGVLDRLRADGFKEVTTELREGDPAAEILAAVDAHQASYLVAATHGRSGLGRILFGSVAARLSRHSPVPTLLVRPGPSAPPRMFRPTSVLVPLDGSPRAEAALAHGDQLARAFGARLLLVRVVPQASTLIAFPELSAEQVRELECDAEETARRYLDDAARRVGPAETVLLRGDAAEVLAGYAQREGVGLVVMTSHGRSGFRGWTLGSVTEHLLRSSQAPILVVPAREGATPRAH